MAQRPYQYTRLIHTFVSIALLIILLIIWRTFYDIAVLVVVPSVIIGFLTGRWDWKKVEKRIDKRNGLILYFSDTYAYDALIMLFLLKAFKGSSRVVGAFFNVSPWVFPFLIWFAAAVAVGYNIAYYLSVRKVETLRGPLRVKRFYARSVVGAESMIGKQGIVTEDCRPGGTVKIENALWTGESIDGTPIATGQAVVVRDIDGLKVFVESVQPN